MFVERFVPRNRHIARRNADTLLFLFEYTTKAKPNQLNYQVGSLIVSHITSFTATWVTLLALLTLHLSLNYAAVRSVQMRTLNRQRANIVFSYMLSSDPDVALLNSGQLLDQRNYAEPADRNQKHLQIPSPAQVSRRERIFEASGTLKWYPCSLREQEERPAKPEILGSCQIGVSPRKFLSSPSSISTSPSSLTTSLPVAALTSLFNNEDYILIFTPMALGPMLKPTAKILLKQNATPKTHLKAWMHALLAARLLARSYSTPAPSKQDGKKRDESFTETETALSILERALRFLNESSRFEGYIGALGDKGWEVDVEGGGVSALETRVGRRVVVS
jgi:hypothetical protein